MISGFATEPGMKYRMLQNQAEFVLLGSTTKFITTDPGTTNNWAGNSKILVISTTAPLVQRLDIPKTHFCVPQGGHKSALERQNLNGVMRQARCRHMSEQAENRPMGMIPMIRQ